MSATLGLEAATLEALGLALVHFLWQGTLLALALAALNGLLRRAAPAARYSLAGATLLVMLLMPVATFVVLRADPPRMHRTETTAPASLAVPDLVNVPPVVGMALAPRLRAAMPALVGLWLLGVLLLSLRSVRGFFEAQRIRRSGVPASVAALEGALARLSHELQVSRPVRLLESALVEVPTVVGWLKPVVLFPASALSGLHPLQVEVILAHELAHIRRLDYLVNLLQGVVETLLFYHPGVWWVSHRMRVEREHCCDDLAVAACGNALGYARALADLEGLRSEPRFAMAATGGSLLERVARLVGAPLPEASWSGRWIAAIVALGALGLALGAGPSLRAGASPKAPAPLAPVGPQSPVEPRPPAEPERESLPGSRAEGRPLPLQTILELAGAGVTPEYIDEMAAVGYPDMSPSELLEARNQGVDADMVKALEGQGLSGLSISDLASLQAQGVDAEYIQGMKKAGFDRLSPSRLIALRSQGVDPDDVAAFKALGYENLSTGRLIVLRSQGVDADYVKEMRDAGYPKLSVPLLLALRQQGVDADFVKELQAEGLTNLEAGTLIELRNQGVDGEFVREMKGAGLGDVSAADLIQLRAQGVSAELVARLRRTR